VSKRSLIRYGSIAGAVVFWFLFGFVNERVGLINPAMIPTPVDVIEAGWELRNVVPLDIAVSLLRALEGFAIAAVLGVLLGCLCGSSRLAEDVIDPILELIRPIPPLAFLPIFIIWFGLGELSKVLMIAFSAFFVIYVNTYQGVRYADPLLMRAALSLGASKRRAFFTISLPSATPEIFTGLRLGMGMSFFVLVAAELLAADSGMGFRIQEARWQFRIDRMIWGAVEIGVIGFILFSMLHAAEARLLAWKPKREGEAA
jgi:ABC-type nitrate/sulfonate/bicarbonate transport system permease component